MSLNKVMLIGNLTKDPELRYIPSGTAVANFSLAINRKYKSGEETKEDVCFVKIVVWGKRAEVCAEYVKKGNPLFVEGRLQQHSWEKDGQKHSALEVVAENVQFIGTPNKKAKTEDDINTDEVDL